MLALVLSSVAAAIPAPALAATGPSTVAASSITQSDAALNGTNGPDAATGHSFWASTGSFSTASPTIPSDVYSTLVLGPVVAGGAMSASLSSTGIPGIAPGTTYYYAAWSEIGGTWYPGEVLSFTTASSLPPAAAIGPAGECSAMLKTYMRLGQSNDVVEVMLLQNFLNIEMGMTLAVSGVFDLPTDTAVRALQAKYATEVLAPWGLTEPTGFVYTLTQWKINDIMCPGLAAKPGVVPGGAGGQGGMGGGTTAPGKQDGIAAGVVLGDENATTTAGASTTAAKNPAAAPLDLMGTTLPGWFWLLVLALILLGYSSWRAYKKYGTQA